MVPGRSRYFIALVPPSPVRDEIHQFKLQMRNEFGSSAALRSPPHLTLHMPFEWRADKEDKLIQSLTDLGQSLTSFPIQLSGFGSFPPRVIFTQVTSSQELIILQKSVRNHCRVKLGLLNSDYRDLPFHPHITIGFRDLKKEAFLAAWAEFQPRIWKGEFKASALVLLRHNGNEWVEYKSFSLKA